MVFLAPLFFLPWAGGIFEIHKLFLWIAFSSFGIVALFARTAITGKEFAVWNIALFRPTVFVFAAAAVSALFSVERWTSLFGTYGEFSDGLLALVAGIFTYVLVIGSSLDFKAGIKTFFLSMFCVAALSYALLFGAFQKLLPAVLYPAGQTGDGLAVLFAFAAVLLLALPDVLPNTYRWILLFAILALLAILDSSPAWIALIGGAVTLVFVSMRRDMEREGRVFFSRHAPFLFLIVFALAFLASPFSVNTPVSFLAETPASRIGAWGIAWKAVTENTKTFFFGSGAGTFQADFSKYHAPNANVIVLWPRAIRHGEGISEMFATLGVVGMAAGIFFVFSLLRFSFGKIFHGKTASDKAQSLLAFTAGAVVLLLSQFFIHGTLALSFLFWLVLGFIGSFSVDSNMIPTLGKGVRRMYVALCALAIAFLTYGTLVFLSDLAYGKSLSVPYALLDKKISAGERAAMMNPYQAEYKIYLTELSLALVRQELQKPQSEQDNMLLVKGMARAIAHGKGGQSDGATLKGAVDVARMRPDAWLALGKAYSSISFASGAGEWTVKAFERAIALAPSEPVPYTELGKFYAASGDLQKARELFDKALALAPEFRDALLESALLAEKEGDFATSVRLLESAAFDYPDAEVFFELGRAYYNSGQFAKAVETLQEAVKLAPGRSNIRYALGSVLAKQGNKAAALAEFQQVLQLNPENQDVLRKIKELR